MLPVIVISPDRELGDRLVHALEATGSFSIARSLDRYPSAIDLSRILRSHAPQALFLSVQSQAQALEAIRAAESESPGLPVVAVHSVCDPQLLLETMRAGVREFITPPFEPAALRDLCQRLQSLLEKHPVAVDATDQIFSFLPAKPGVGASTIAANVSAAIARVPNTTAALCDFDLNSGMVRFLLKLTNEYAVTDAIEHAANMDEQLWPQLVTRFDRLDVLHAGRPNPSLRIDPDSVHYLINFLRRQYKVLCFDLSGNLERYSMEIMRDSRRVVLVCTPEIASLHMAREKLAYLKDAGLEGRVSVVVNRAQKRPLISVEQIEELLRVSVFRRVPNDYAGVMKAMTAGTWVEKASELGRCFNEFANALLDRRPVGETGPKKKFIEFFSVHNRSLAIRE